MICRIGCAINPYKGLTESLFVWSGIECNFVYVPAIACGGFHKELRLVLSRVTRANLGLAVHF